VQWIAPSMRVNGVPTRVMQFQSRISRSEVVDYYRAQWSRGFEHAPVIHTLGAATVIGQLQGSYLMTVKVEEGDRETSLGVISVAQVIGSSVDRDPGEVPLMGGAHVVSAVESDDLGKHSRQVLILAPQPPASVSQFYQASFVNAGWTQVQGAGNAGGSAGSFVVFAQSGREIHLSIVPASKGGGSTVLANLVTKGTGPVSH